MITMWTYAPVVYEPSGKPFCVQAIKDLLTARFLFGDTPTAAGISVAPQLGAMMAIPLPTLLGDRLRGDQELVDYVAHVYEALL
ncbi:glutathione S-transferase family protein [Yoonia sp. MH D7]